MDHHRIKPFDVTIESHRLPEEWETWRQDLESYFVVHNVECQRDKRAHLAYLGGPGIQRLLNFTPAANKVPHVSPDPPFYDVAIQCLNEHFEPFRRKTYERHLFHKMEQNQGERFSDFVMRLRKQMTRCGYSEKVSEDLIADRIAAGCNSDELRQKLLQKDRPLSKILAMGSSSEEVGKQARKWTDNTVHTASPEVSRIGSRPLGRERTPRDQNPGEQRLDKRRFPRNPYRWQNPSYANRSVQSTCHRCGYPGHWRGDEHCPAREDTCGICGKVGHWAVRCFNRTRAPKRSLEEPSDRTKVKRIRAVTEETENQEAKDYVFYAMGRNVFAFQVGGVEIPMTIDSGADANIVTQSVWEQMKTADVNAFDLTTEVDRTLTSYAAKKPMTIIGMFKAEIVAGSNRTFAKFYVVKDGQQCLLGDRTAKELKVLKVGFDVGAVEGLKSKAFPKNSRRSSGDTYRH